MIKQFTEWLNESKISPRHFAMEFIKDLENSRLTNAKFEDWWSVPGRDYDEHDIGYLENLERIERRKPAHSRYNGDVYYIELKVYKQSSHTVHTWELIILDTRTWKLRIPSESDMDCADEIRKIFGKLLKEHYPQEYHGQRYGI